jgi:hypothetical protein
MPRWRNGGSKQAAVHVILLLFVSTLSAQKVLSQLKPFDQSTDRRLANHPHHATHAVASLNPISSCNRRRSQRDPEAARQAMRNRRLLSNYQGLSVLYKALALRHAASPLFLHRNLR